jgi:hypothetical protein
LLFCCVWVCGLLFVVTTCGTAQAAIARFVIITFAPLQHNQRNPPPLLFPTRYTTVKVGVPFSAITAMNMPAVNTATNDRTIFFAGEHTCGAFQGYLHGAYYSGLRAATMAAQSGLLESPASSAARAESVGDLTYTNECNVLRNMRSGNDE